MLALEAQGECDGGRERRSQSRLGGGDESSGGRRGQERPGTGGGGTLTIDTVTWMSRLGIGPCSRDPGPRLRPGTMLRLCMSTLL